MSRNPPLLFFFPSAIPIVGKTEYAISAKESACNRRHQEGNKQRVRAFDGCPCKNKRQQAKYAETEDRLFFARVHT